MIDRGDGVELGLGVTAGVGVGSGTRDTDAFATVAFDAA